MTKEEIQNGVDRLCPWYHSVELPHGIITPGQFKYPNWDMIRGVRSGIDYKNKIVLDIATFDGMWAFEAERMGPDLVIAADCNWRSIPHFMFCHGVLQSNVVPFFNVGLHQLVDRLDSFLVGNDVFWHGLDTRPTWKNPRFDIIQHFGLLYHLADPMTSLFQCRSIISDDGTLILETAYSDGDSSTMFFNIERGNRCRFYDKDFSTWWAPTITCLEDMLLASMFEPIQIEKLSEKMPETGVSRCCIVAKPTNDVDPVLARELLNRHRNFGYVQHPSID